MTTPDMLLTPTQKRWADHFIETNDALAATRLVYNAKERHGVHNMTYKLRRNAKILDYIAYQLTLDDLPGRAVQTISDALGATKKAVPDHAVRLRAARLVTELLGLAAYLGYSFQGRLRARCACVWPPPLCPHGQTYRAPRGTWCLRFSPAPVP